MSFKFNSQYIKNRYPYVQGKLFGEILNLINAIEHTIDNDDIIVNVIDNFVESKYVPQLKLQSALKLSKRNFLKSEGTDFEIENYSNVVGTLKEISKTPTVLDIAVMPDACPTGEYSVPVGSVIKTENAIHPGWHSADVCCSLMTTSLGNVNISDVVNALEDSTHFGTSKSDNSEFENHIRSQHFSNLIQRAASNKFLNSEKSLSLMVSHLGTQGDGNHFANVGVSKNTGRIHITTHHGSRGFGANLYKEGMKVAEKYRKQFSPHTRKENAWIPFNTRDGAAYWEALQIVREWTRYNHFAIHNLTSKKLESRGINVEIYDNFWNEHNFVFKDGDFFYHAKGATPVCRNIRSSTDRRTIIPLNMASPILIVSDNVVNHDAMKFAPHGAGRLQSRSSFLKSKIAEYQNIHPDNIVYKMLEDECAGLDIRAYSGLVDISEMPSAYKDADQIRADIIDNQYGEIEDEIIPYASIMAGHFDQRKI